jgi:hypothetical protein
MEGSPGQISRDWTPDKNAQIPAERINFPATRRTLQAVLLKAHDTKQVRIGDEYGEIDRNETNAGVNLTRDALPVVKTRISKTISFQHKFPGPYLNINILLEFTVFDSTLCNLMGELPALQT